LFRLAKKSILLIFVTKSSDPFLLYLAIYYNPGNVYFVCYIIYFENGISEAGEDEEYVIMGY